MTRPVATPICGMIGFMVGAIALFSAMYVFWAGPFAPQQSAGVSIGELAADIGKSAIRSVAGAAQPAPEPIVRDLDDHLQVAVAMLGGLAMVLSFAALVRHESMRPAYAAAVLGMGAILFQLFTWTIMMIIGALLILAILQNLTEFFESLFGG